MRVKVAVVSWDAIMESGLVERALSRYLYYAWVVDK